MRIADADFLIDAMNPKREHHDRARAKVESLDEDGELVYVASVTRFELFAGAELYVDPPAERRRIEKILSSFPSLPLTAASADRAGLLHGRLAREGMPIGPFDALLAGIALEAGMHVVTRNVKDFAKVQGVKIDEY